jgi:hypothetical protein
MERKIPTWTRVVLSKPKSWGEVGEMRGKVSKSAALEVSKLSRFYPLGAEEVGGEY